MNICSHTHTRAQAHLLHLPAANVLTQQDFEEITCVKEQFDVIFQTRNKMSHVEGEHDFPEITNVEDQLDILLQTQKTAFMLPLGPDTVVRFETNFDHQISSVGTDKSNDLDHFAK